ncbi:MAG TPA: succinate dehydrogenase [Armatimonadetes bacterium]|nr:succinate dehydrogenase [Armatimonadota bacterium]HCM73812.1 succinate dehydrogenase [Armatimonadota bacterium]
MLPVARRGGRGRPEPTLTTAAYLSRINKDGMRENYTLHKLHSLTGVIPVGFYLIQHLTLNSFSLAGPQYFNGVIHFFESIPVHVFWVLKYGVIWGSIIFHALYGFVIASRGELTNYVGQNRKYRENRYYQLQRVSGIVAMLFLIYHVASTSVLGTIKGQESVNYYHNWADKLAGPTFGIPYLILAIYIIGILASAYHFAYGLWNFCIRWGITVSESSQNAMAKVAKIAFPAISLIGIAALFGFFLHEDPKHPKTGSYSESGLSRQQSPALEGEQQF